MTARVGPDGGTPPDVGAKFDCASEIEYRTYRSLPLRSARIGPLNVLTPWSTSDEVLPALQPTPAGVAANCAALLTTISLVGSAPVVHDLPPSLLVETNSASA